MTFNTYLCAQIFDWKILPVLHVALTVKVIGKTFPLHAKILGHKYVPGHQDKGNKCDCNPQRPQYMIFHKIPPFLNNI
jgi:hypothetical protein